MARGYIGFDPKGGNRGLTKATVSAPLVYSTVAFTTDAKAGRPTATANLAVPVTVPTVQVGDTLFLVTEVAVSAATFTVSGLEFTASTASSRAGLTSQLWSRKVLSTAEAGTVLQVNTPQALVFRAHLTGWRNVNTFNVTSTNTGSAGTLTIPAYTPTPDTVPIQCLSVSRTTGVAADFTPPVGITEVASFNPDINVVTGSSWGLGTRNTPADSVWGGQNTFISAGWLITATPTTA